MKNILLTIEYDGTNYHGWQKQKNAITVQQVIEKGIIQVTGEEVNLIGSGRTDSGVHATGQKANFRTSSTVPVFKLPVALNSVLPSDIRIIGAQIVPVDFHARYNALRKRYRYRIYNNAFPSAIYRNYCYFVSNKLDVGKMRKAAEYMLGQRDFTSFCSSGSSSNSKIRNIYLLDIVNDGVMIDIIIEADGFLYNMVRIICGTLLETGIGKNRPEHVQRILAEKDRRFAGPTLAPHGLFLEKVYYAMDS